MKIKSIIKLICLVLVLAFFSVWAFNGMTVFTSKLQRPDSVMNKDGTLGIKYVAYYSITPNENEEDAVAEAEADTDVTLEDDELTDEETVVDDETDAAEETVVDDETDAAEETVVDDETDAAEETVVDDETDASEETVVADAALTNEAVNVFRKRMEAIGYTDAEVTMINNNLVRVEIPGVTSSSGLEDFFENTGKLEITNDDAVVFTNDDIKDAKIIGYDSDAQLFYIQLSLKRDAKERLKNLTSNGAYSMDVSMDDVVSVTYSGSEAVKDGKMKIGFSTSTYTDAYPLVYCVNAGVIDGTITAETDMGKINAASVGDDAYIVCGIALAGLFAIAAVYFIISKKLMGVAATVAAYAAILLVDFFGATFTWMSVGTMGLLGLIAAVLLSFVAIALVLNAIGRRYAAGRNAVDAIKAGVSDMVYVVLELCGIVSVGGIGLWICGGAVAGFGVALFGGAFIAAFVSLVLVKSIIKIFVGFGAGAKAFGLKRGE